MSIKYQCDCCSELFDDRSKVKASLRLASGVEEEDDSRYTKKISKGLEHVCYECYKDLNTAIENVQKAKRGKVIGCI